jgi:hypothetical protein
VVTIQDRTASLEIRAGNATATAAKLFEAVHKARDAGQSIDQVLYDLNVDKFGTFGAIRAWFLRETPTKPSRTARGWPRRSGRPAGTC